MYVVIVKQARICDNEKSIMNKLQFGEKYGAPLVIVLGFFDCIHLGHRDLVLCAKDYAAKNNLESALFTFSNDPSVLFGSEKQIYSFDERLEALSALGLENIISTNFDSDFAATSPLTFLDTLTQSLSIRAIVVGSDYTFGKDALGNVDMLMEYCRAHDIDIIVKPFTLHDGSKISTRSLKNLVKTGRIGELNNLLSEPYFMLGKVEHARHVGTGMGFPTANISTNDSKLPLADGIYATRIHVDGRCYNAMTNIGAKPTFDVYKPSVETYIFDFSGDLYGKTVKLSFFERTRDVTKFSSADELKAQLTMDERQIRALLQSVGE